MRLAFTTGVAESRDAAIALAHKYHDAGAVARTFALAFAHGQSGRRHLGISSDEAVLFERLASRVLYTDASLRARARAAGENTLGQEGLWPHSISGDLPILLVRVVEEDDLPLVRQVLQAQEYWRLKGLAADVVVVNENPLGYLDAMQAALEALLDEGPWRSWRHRPGGAYLLRGERLSRGRAHAAPERGARRAQPAIAASSPTSSIGSIPSAPHRSRCRCSPRRPGTRLTPVHGTPPRLPRCPTSCSTTTSAASPPTGAST